MLVAHTKKGNTDLLVAAVLSGVNTIFVGREKSAGESPD